VSPQSPAHLTNLGLAALSALTSNDKSREAAAEAEAEVAIDEEASIAAPKSMAVTVLISITRRMSISIISTIIISITRIIISSTIGIGGRHLARAHLALSHRADTARIIDGQEPGEMLVTPAMTLTGSFRRSLIWRCFVRRCAEFRTYYVPITSTGSSLSLTSSAWLV
jgi:hypothetical protein